MLGAVNNDVAHAELTIKDEVKRVVQFLRVLSAHNTQIVIELRRIGNAVPSSYTNDQQRGIDLIMSRISDDELVACLCNCASKDPGHSHRERLRELLDEYTTDPESLAMLLDQIEDDDKQAEAEDKVDPGSGLVEGGNETDDDDGAEARRAIELVAQRQLQDALTESAGGQAPPTSASTQEATISTQRLDLFRKAHLLAIDQSPVFSHSSGVADINLAKYAINNELGEEFPHFNDAETLQAYKALAREGVASLLRDQVGPPGCFPQEELDEVQAEEDEWAAAVAEDARMKAQDRLARDLQMLETGVLYADDGDDEEEV